MSSETQGNTAVTVTVIKDSTTQESELRITEELAGKLLTVPKAEAEEVHNNHQP